MVKSTLQYEAPNFTEIKDEHFLPAFEEGMKQHMVEVLAIANNPEPATFDNTLVALEKSGELLTRTSRVFYNLSGSDSNPERRKIQSELAPKMAAHSDNISLNPQLFARIKSLYNQRNELKLDSESVRLIEVYYERFIRAGAELTEEQKTAIRALNEEHSKLTTQFSQNLLAETKKIAVIVDSKDELDGLSDAQITAAANAAKDAGHEGKYLLSITNTTRQPVLAQLSNRELRKRVWEASANRAQSGETDNRPLVARLAQLRADGKHVIVIGGGDTGSDCVGTSNRHGAASVTQFEVMPQPPEEENKPLVWPYWPLKLRTSSSHEEGCVREFAISTKEFTGEKGKVKGLTTVQVEFKDGKLVEIAGTEKHYQADLVLLAMGFTAPVAAVLDAFGIEKDARGNARASTDFTGGYATSVPKVFAAGDIRRGQSLVVWAIREGRQAARAVDEFLMGSSELPR